MTTLNKQTILYKTLARALSMMRPHNSEGTRRLTDWLQERAPAHAKMHRDAIGNLHIDTRISPDNRTLFVAHVDTVHRKEGANKIRQTETHWYADGAALGADDGAGVAMLMHLLHAGVDAYYIFTQGEECGGIGATHLAKHERELLSEFDRAIAFDRRGIDSVITHQGRGRCCSDAFGEALSNALNDDMTLMYLPDNTGVYTDTAEFIDIIPECTNISVGYYSEHSDKESLDVVHFVALAERVAKIDWDALPTDRDPKVIDKLDWAGWGSYYSPSLTGVNSLGVSAGEWAGLHHLDDDDYDYDMDSYTIELQEALYDAQAGSKQWLIELMCESVWPEDPEMAERLIDRNKIDEVLLAHALKISTTYNPDAVLAEIFDQSYAA
jgi:hypothetical protein